MTNHRGPMPSDNPRRRNKKPDLGLSTIEAKAPAVPKELKGEARAEWKRIVPELERVGLLAKVDRALLIRYCSAWASWHRINAELEKPETTLLVAGRDGSMIRNPLYLLKAQAQREVDESARLLGLTPTGRLRSGVKHVRPTGEKVTQAERDAGIPSIDERRRAMMQS